MDVIILAAGENVRLQVAGLMPGHKPLLMVENEVLIRRLCRQARTWTAGRIIIVCSPMNAPEIVYATRIFGPHYVVQPDAIGPQDAVDRAFDLTTTHNIALLMGDNYFTNVPFMSDTPWPSISVTYDHDEALQPLRDGRFVPTHDDADAWWLGPLMFPRKQWLRGQSTWVNAFGTIRFSTFKGDTQDLGTLK